MKRWMLAGLLGMLALPLAAQKYYRCGPDGRVFTDRPCAEAKVIEAPPAPPPEATAEARAVAAREREALRSLAAERKARYAEAQERGAAAAAVRPAAPSSAASAPSKPWKARRPRDAG